MYCNSIVVCVTILTFGLNDILLSLLLPTRIAFDLLSYMLLETVLETLEVWTKLCWETKLGNVFNEGTLTS